jgi:hypothetical protein
MLALALEGGCCHLAGRAVAPYHYVSRYDWLEKPFTSPVQRGAQLAQSMVGSDVVLVLVQAGGRVITATVPADAQPGDAFPVDVPLELSRVEWIKRAPRQVTKATGGVLGHVRWPPHVAVLAGLSSRHRSSPAGGALGGEGRWPAAACGAMDGRAGGAWGAVADVAGAARQLG